MHFQADGATVSVSGGMDPTQPGKSFLILWAEGKAAFIFDIQAALSKPSTLRVFGLNGPSLVLQSDPKGLWSVAEDSAFNIRRNAGTREDPKAGQLLLRVTLAQLKQALYELGTPVPVGPEEFRLFYGDVVTRGEKWYQLGPARALVFVQRLSDGSFAKPILVEAAALKPRQPLRVELSKRSAVMLTLAGPDELEVQTVREDGK